MSDTILEPTADNPETGIAMTPAQEATAKLKELHPNIVADDTREGYEGLIIYPDSITEVAKTLRDDLGFNYLSSVTGVDLFEEGKMEVVYHLYNISRGGGPIVLKAQVNRDEPVLPSLVPVFPGADFQEREAFDMYGFHFQGHPDLRRILTWDGFHGHPLAQRLERAFLRRRVQTFRQPLARRQRFPR
jgi:NADH-quinone oxidoreductase subunit C/D